MTTLFDDIAEELADAFRSERAVLPVVVSRFTPGEVDPSAPWEPVSGTTDEWVLDGWTEEWTDEWIERGVVETGDARVLVLTHGAPALPEVGDTVMVGSMTGTVVQLMPDTSGAVLGVQVRR